MQQIRHFLAVAEHGSIGGAAEALNLSQPGLSRSIRALEDALGTALFERRARGVELTDFGRTLKARAYVIRNEHDRALAEAQAVRSLRSGDLRLGLQGALTWLGATQVVNAFMDSHPGIRLSIVTASGLELAGKIASAELDLAFTLFPTMAKPGDLVMEDLFSLPCRIYQRVGAARSIAQVSDLADLSDHGWALAGGLNFRAALDTAFNARGLALPARFLQCSSLGLLLDLILTRDMLTVLPERMAQVPHLAGKLESCDVAAPGGSPHGGLLYRREALHIAPVRKMAQSFRALGAALAEGQFPAAF